MEPSTPQHPSDGGPRLRHLTGADWRTFAELRLRALTDALGTDEAEHREESSFTAAQWRRRLRAHAQFAVYRGDQPVGLIGAQRERADSVYLYSLWLEPGSRGRGLGNALLTAAIDWAREQGARTVTLRVQDTNDAARRVYERSGFRMVRARSDAPTDELTMSLVVG